ncbi:aldehyde dehydrogenase [Salinarchaeum sp. Harcht-Bsk1]|uniref:aldehyde dehydrogenase family protein n=1 Tax=Salinarchaeum sp. Harcht-Bsk1 TaxID=1333523 RepID=UPI0003423B0C|nr:aldehyde dehydrogenase family protein [Salinarchaeum sp. Harcht-Bsk1]AGN00156.1 aldehyde dehydrogenase [Salinarchaeum sp. Harcht-Bsk1]
MATPEQQTESGWDRMYVDGEWREASGGDTMPVENPATREPFTEVPAATAADVDAAYEAAAAAQPEWAAKSREERLEYVQAAHDHLQERFEEVVGLLAREGGSAQNKATGEVAISLSDFKTALQQEPPADEERESAFFGESKTHHIVQEPVGVVGIISPWNYPLHLSTRALAPALALGNTVVLKPATDTPITGGLLLAEIADEVGFPDGVVNVVTGRGSEIGDRMAGHPVPRVLSFTGSTSVGKSVASAAGSTVTLPALELGGNAPNVVTEDVDVEQAAKIGAVGSFTHQGQVCISINRHLVHEDVYDEYVELLAEHAESLAVGDPSENPAVDFGPVVNETQRDDLLEFVEQSVDEGATLETGGDADGLFVEPTVLSDATNDMAAACDEHFGPIAPVIPISGDEEAIELANDTEYGLSAAVQCDDVERARSIADRIDAGMVHVNDHPIQDEPNAPFGGMKQSGLGRYNGEWIVDELLETKWISVQHEEREYDLL